MHARNLPSRRFCWLFLSLSLCSLSPALAPAAVEMNASNGFPHELNVTGGVIRGRALPSGEGTVFKGIPFAQPPVGELRWREPMPVVPWNGIREATESGPPAAQASFGWNDNFAKASREDCLYLDVWTPAKLPAERLPVMVWIHGGSNLAGTGGGDPLNQGGVIIRHGVILVLIEYRVGLFGFLAHPELTRESPHHSSGNYGLLDQIAALRWIHDNITKFGGDPNNVTLFGQSAGSMDILSLMTSPLAHGLFQRAIGESGPAPFGGMTGTLAAAERAGEESAAELKAPKENSLAYLRSLPAEALAQAKTKVIPLCVDGWILSATPNSVFFTGKESAIPLLIGTNAIEFPWGGTS
ncbi:MAG: carboxylesterase family protein, partial [Lacunisphaera sp.]